MSHAILRCGWDPTCILPDGAWQTVFPLFPSHPSARPTVTIPVPVAREHCVTPPVETLTVELRIHQGHKPGLYISVDIVMKESTKRPTVTLRSQQPKTAFTKLGGKSDDQEGSQIWRNAIQRYYDELEKGGIKGPAIEKDLWNVESAMDLLEQMKTLEPQDWKSMDANKNLINRLEPVLLSLSDFAAVTACAFGMNGKAVVAAVVWGSIRLLLKVRGYVFKGFPSTDF